MLTLFKNNILMITLKKVKVSDRDLLWNINQKYLYEMTNFYDDPMDENGNYHYGYFDEYFTDLNRVAYFIYSDKTLIGFVLLNPYSYIGQSPDYVMAEFTIFPQYRRCHYAYEAATLVLLKHPGNWEIKYNEKNRPAKSLWIKIASKYDYKTISLNNEETVLVFNTLKE